MDDKAKDSNAHTSATFNGPVSESNFRCGTVNITKNIYQATTEQNQNQTPAAYEDYSRLKNCLKDELEIIYGTRDDDLPVDKPIDLAPVQICQASSSGGKNPNDIGHFHRREDIKKLYNFYSSSNKTVSLDNLFLLAQENAEKRANNCCKGSKAKEKYVQKHGNVVGVCGQPGIGKTTLTKTVAKRASEDGLFGVGCCFYIQLRDVDYKRNMSLLDFLLTNFPDIKSQFQENTKRIHQDIIKSDDILIVMDGLDEADVKFDSKCPIGSLESETAESFIKNLLAGNILPKAKKFITSRPHAMYKLHKDYRPHFIADIMGFNEDAKEQICRDICEDKHDAVSENLKRYPDISAYCYVPFNCIIIIHCILMNLSGEGEENMKIYSIGSLTQIFARALYWFIKSSRLREGDFECEKLAHLAWYGFNSSKSSFEKKDFEAVGISEDNKTTFLNAWIGGRIKGKILQGQRRTYFSHLILQEFFVALKLMLFMTVEEFRNHKEKLLEDRFEVVTKFAFGLCNDKTLDILSDFIPDVVSSFIVELKNEKADILKVLAKPGLGDPVRLDSRFLSKCEWIHEMHDDKFATEIAEKLPECVFRSPDSKFSFVFCPNEITAFHYLLQSRRSKLDLRLTDIGYENNCLVPFFKQFKTTLQYAPRLKVTKLSFPMNSLTDDDLYAVLDNLEIDNIDILLLKYKRFTKMGIEHLKEKMLQKKMPMQRLDLSNNNLNDEALTILSKCVRKTESLNLGRNNFTTKGLKKLMHEISQSETPLRSLGLYENHINDEGLAAISNGVHNLQSLYLHGNDITSQEITILSAAILKDSCRMKHLDLSRNNIGDEGTQALSICIRCIDELNISCNNIGPQGVKALSEAIEKRVERMVYLNISHNQVTGRGLVEISRCVGKIEELKMKDCEVSSADLQEFFTSLKTRNVILNSLDVSFNDSDDDVLIAMSQCISQFESLGLTYEQTDETLNGVKILCKSIKELPMPMKSLYFTCDELIFEDCCREFKSCKKNIEEFSPSVTKT